MGDFAVQFNKNSFGLAPASALAVPTLTPNQSIETSLALNNSKQQLLCYLRTVGACLGYFGL
jgi:hypothetical protein